jgi:hypothetical protein
VKIASDYRKEIAGRFGSKRDNFLFEDAGGPVG